MRGKNMQQREVTHDLSASFSACTEGTHQHFTHCMHTLTHKECTVYIQAYLQPHTHLEEELEQPIPNCESP